MGAIDDLILNRAKPKTLFHYTSQAGLLGILHSRSVWATDIRFLNDSREYQVIQSVATECIDRRLSGTLTAADRHLLEKLRLIAEHSLSLTVFVFSLSEVGDQLSQWRGYCPDGNGFALGFDVNSLERVAQPQTFTLYPCLYAPADHEAVVDAIIDEALYLLDNPVFPSGGAVVNATSAAAVLFYDRFTSIAPCLKDPAFAEEKEWRLVSEISGDRYDHPLWGCRASRSGLRPHIGVRIAAPDDGSIFLQDVVVGPSLNPEGSRHVVRNLFLKHKVAWNGIFLSAVPYREW